MLRDKDLIRWILQQARAAPPILRGPRGVRVPPAPGVSLPEMHEHVRLLEEGGYIEAIIASNGKFFLIRRLTSAGHDFVEAADDDQVWNAAKGIAGNAPLNVFGQVLRTLCEEAFKRRVGSGQGAETEIPSTPAHQTLDAPGPWAAQAVQAAQEGGQRHPATREVTGGKPFAGGVIEGSWRTPGRPLWQTHDRTPPAVGRD
ncbi:MAG: DUF2513 domain-containing protein [Verrucomicrobia bacterium]|nr:DUF2513 domain-containing protein [Verrucomicrobiota bacterium]